MVPLPASVLRRYRAFSLYNSPYPVHEEGRAIDLYPAAGAPSPVAGEVVGTRTVRAPRTPGTDYHDHVIVIDAGERLARLLHVEPAVEAGDRVAVGDDLGDLVRSGYFAPWVDDHLHLGFRPPDADPYRATGSLPVHPDVGVEPVAWDGLGRVVERDETAVVLDAPGHPAPGERFAGIAGIGGARSDPGAVDGGFPHYRGGGLLRGDGAPVSDGNGDAPDRGIDASPAGVPVSLLGDRVGVTRGRTVAWDDLEVRANGAAITGVSLACHRDRLGVKLVSWAGIPAEVGDRVEVTVHRS